MKKIILDENEIPKEWYNIQADLKTPLDPPLNPKTKEPIGPEFIAYGGHLPYIEQNVWKKR